IQTSTRVGFGSPARMQTSAESLEANADRRDRAGNTSCSPRPIGAPLLRRDVHYMVKILVCRLLMTMSLIIAIAAPAAAQQASITGTVADSTDLPLPGVTVVVTNGDTGVPITVVSDARGEYRVQR